MHAAALPASPRLAVGVKRGEERGRSRTMSAIAISTRWTSAPHSKQKPLKAVSVLHELTVFP
jgi:hypothetical protein